MPNEISFAMRQSIIDGAPDTAARLAQRAVGDGMPPPDAINHGYVPGMHALGEHFARGQMFLPDMMASAEAMRAAMAVLDPELRKPGRAAPDGGRRGAGDDEGRHPRGAVVPGKAGRDRGVLGFQLAHAAGVASH